MSEVPDYEEIYGSDPNDAKHFEPKHSFDVPKTGPKATSWIVVGRLGDLEDKKLFALKIQDEKLYWSRPTSADKEDWKNMVTVFTDIREADKAMFAAKELFPEFTIWVN